MGTIRDLPTTYDEARRLVDQSRYGRRKIANNTELTLHVSVNGWDQTAVTLRLHGHPIIVFFEDGTIELRDCGWQTVTTKQRLNAVARPHGFSISQKDYRWYITDTRLRGVEGDTRPWDGSFTIPAPNPEKIGTYCECGASYDPMLRGYRCAVR